jgi:hypothetical protein
VARLNNRVDDVLPDEAPTSPVCERSERSHAVSVNNAIAPGRRVRDRRLATFTFEHRDALL